MCLIGDFVLTGNEGLKLQASGYLQERGSEGKLFNYKRQLVKYAANSVKHKSYILSYMYIHIHVHSKNRKENYNNT